MKSKYIGQKLGKLTILDKFTDEKGVAMFKCKCDCGKIANLRYSNVISGNTKSCGCSQFNKVPIHGMAGTKFYQRYDSMKRKCYKKSDRNYRSFGGKGIKVCDRWKTFENFKADMYDSYCQHVKEYGERNTTLDRINLKGDFEPSNCKWVTRKENINNLCGNRSFEYKGSLYTITELTRMTGVNRCTLFDRIVKHGWSVEDAVSFPRFQTRKKIFIDGKGYTIQEYCDLKNFSYRNLRHTAKKKNMKVTDLIKEAGI